MNRFMRREAILVLPRRMYDPDEAIGLVRTALYEPIEIVRVRGRTTPYYIGRGKLEELRSLVDGKVGDLTLIVFDDLKPRESYGISKTLGIRVIDRVQLILEIFALHAGSQEAKLQIELARMKYELPLVRELVRRSKMGELPGFLGPGRYAIDEYYRLMRRRIVAISRKLEELRERRRRERLSRRRTRLPHVAIAGYTNAGKTTLFNKITLESKPTGDTFFTTISPKSKRGRLLGREAIFVDTVGFIKNVPPQIIEAFYATLEEIVDADAIILVYDVSEDWARIRRRLEGSIEILRELGVSGKPVILAANKADLAGWDEAEERSGKSLDLVSELYGGPLRAVTISALKGLNLDKLGEALWGILRMPRYMF